MVEDNVEGELAIELDLVKLVNELGIKDYSLNEKVKILTFQYVEDFNSFFPRLNAIPRNVNFNYRHWFMFTYKGWYVQVNSADHKPKIKKSNTL